MHIHRKNTCRNTFLASSSWKRSFFSSLVTCSSFCRAPTHWSKQDPLVRNLYNTVQLLQPKSLCCGSQTLFRIRFIRKFWISFLPAYFKFKKKKYSKFQQKYKLLLTSCLFEPIFVIYNNTKEYTTLAIVTRFKVPY
jgi:hypothetical protein